MVLLTKLITPDGTELVSRYRHDFQTYTDKNGKWYMIDGGSDYCRSSANGDEKFIQITTNDNFELIRDSYRRYNKYSKEYIKLSEMSCDWLQNLIDLFIIEEVTENPLFRIFLEEKIYRTEKEIYIAENEQKSKELLGH